MLLRPYQIDAINAIFDYYTKLATIANGQQLNPLIAMPTGTGKSHVIAEIIKQIIMRYPAATFIMSTHVKELVQQNYNKLKEAWPSAPVGINSAGLNKRETMWPIIFGGIKSMLPQVEYLGYRDFLIIDEAHLLSPDSETQYREFIDKLKVYNPNIRIIGLTATPYRNQLGLLTNGGIFTSIVYDITSKDNFNQLIIDGYICAPVARRMKTEFDISGVKIARGEYVQSELRAVMDRDTTTDAALKEVLFYGKERKSWLIFCSGVEHSEHVSEKLNKLGISCAYVHSKVLDKERDQIIASFKAGKITAIANNNVLTTGFDHPAIDLIVMLRPTTSTGLWVQMVGRGTRPYPGKSDCLVLDFAGNTARLGPINDPVIPRKKGEGPPGEAPIRICDACGVYNHAAARSCSACGFIFVIKNKLEQRASLQPILSEQPKIETIEVEKIFYNKHVKANSLPTLKVSYWSALTKYNEFICFEHTGYAKHKANDWWKQRHRLEPPDTVDQALSVIAELRPPKSIRVWVNRKPYPEILSYAY